MAQQAAPLRRRILAAALKELRGERRQEDVATWTGYSQSMISYLERAERVIETKHVRMLCQCYGVDAPEADRLIRMAEESEERGILVDHAGTIPNFASTYIADESIADELVVYHGHWVFGLHQPSAYIRHARLGVNPDLTEKDLLRSESLRLDRQKCLDGGNPPRIRVIYDEAVFHHQVGDAEVMRLTIDRIKAESERDGTSVQVVPFGAGPYLSMGQDFTVVQFDEHPSMNYVYTEQGRSSTYYERPVDVAFYLARFEQVQKRALTPQGTRELLDRLRNDLWKQ